MSHFGRVQVLTYMRSVVDRHADPRTGEVNTTLLAEDALDEFDAFNDPDAEENAAMWAVDVAEEYEGQQNSLLGVGRAVSPFMGDSSYF